MSRFDRAHLVSYNRSVVTMALSCIVSHIQILVEVAKFICLPVLNAPVGGDPVGVTPSGWPRRGWPRRKFAKMFSSMFNVEIEEAHTCKYLGVYLDDQLNWKHHIDYIYEKLVKFTGIFYRLRSKISSEWLTNIYYYFAYAHLLYGIEMYPNTTCVKLLIYTVFKKNMWPRFWW